MSLSEFIFAFVTVYNLGELSVQPTSPFGESYVFKAPYGLMHKAASIVEIGYWIMYQGERRTTPATLLYSLLVNGKFSLV
jgi:hypothetical protein